MSLLDLVIKTMEDKKANDVTVIDFKNTSPICDAYVVCDAPSQRQVQAIAESLEEAITAAGYTIKHPAKRTDSGWILIDAQDVVAHVFQTEERQRYNLEKLYKEFVDEKVL